jgi:hypothetical protein
MKLFRSLTFLVLLLVCALYSYWLTNKDVQWIVPYQDERQPAAVHHDAGVSDVVGKPMRVFKREIVASSILIRAKDDRFSFSMGQFPVKTKTAQGENLICLEYPYMLLTFTGEGATIGGRKTQLTVMAPCKVNAKNQDFITSIPLPFGEMERHPAENAEFEISDSDNTSQIKIENVIGGNWPKQWQLESVEFHRDPAYKMTDKVIITTDELRQQLGEPIFVK